MAGHASNPLLAGPNAQKVLDDIGKLCSPHFSLLYDIEDTGNMTLTRTTPTTRYISREVNKLLTDSDPDDVRGIVESCGRRAAPSKRIEWRGEAITVWLSPKALKPGERGCSGKKSHRHQKDECETDRPDIIDSRGVGGQGKVLQKTERSPAFGCKCGQFVFLVRQGCP